MTPHFSTSDLQIISEEPRLLDLTLAGALGFSKRHHIRDLIKRNEGELARYGQVCATVARTRAEEDEVRPTVGQTPAADEGGFPHGAENPPSVTVRRNPGGRPGVEYWLNEPQAILIAMLSRTDRAADVRFEIVQVYLEYRRRKAAPPEEPAPFPSPSPDSGMLPVAVFQLDLMKFVLRSEGREAVRRMWPQMNCLPPIPGVSLPPPPSKAGSACLAHFLSAMAAPAENKRWAAFVEDALRDGDFYEEIDLGTNGMRLAEDASGIVFANGHFGLEKIFAGTPWADGRWSYALRHLPGAHTVGAQRFGGVTCRGVFVPADLLIEAAIGANPR